MTGALGKARPNAEMPPQWGPYPGTGAQHGLSWPCSEAGAVLSAKVKSSVVVFSELGCCLLVVMGSDNGRVANEILTSIHSLGISSTPDAICTCG